MEFGLSLRGVCLKNLILFSCLISIYGRKPCLGDLIKEPFNTDLHSDTYRPIFFKQGLVLDMLKVYSFFFFFFCVPNHARSSVL